MTQLPNDLVQAIHDYLMGRPMREVEALVVAIRQAAQAPKEEGK